MGVILSFLHQSQMLFGTFSYGWADTDTSISEYSGES